MSITLHALPELEWNNLQDSRIAFNTPASSFTRNNLVFTFPIKLKTYRLRDSQYKFGDLILSNCIFNNEVEIGDYFCAGIIYFTDCEFQANVTFDSNDNVEFKGCTFRGDLIICQIGKDRTISNITVAGTLQTVCTRNNMLFLENINSQAEIAHQNLELKGTFSSVFMKNCCFAELRFLKAIIENSLHIEKSIVNVVLLTFVKFLKGGIWIKNSEFNRIIADGSDKIGESFNIYGSKTSGDLYLPLATFSIVRVKDSQLRTLKISERSNKDDRVNIERTTVSTLHFDDIINEGLLSFRQLKIPSDGLIKIKSSNLGRTEFILCEIKKSKFEFENSKMTEIFLAETEFPETIELNNQENPKQAQLAFGQISAAFQKQGDTVRSLEYQAREIEAHYKQLRLYNVEERNLSFTKISLWLNKWSNDFGRSWQRGILFLMTAGIIFFYLLVISSKSYHFGFPITIDSRLFVSYLRFMNPLRFFELESIFKLGSDVQIITLSKWSYLWDFLGRIFVAYGFYQTIQAFRRYGRK